MLVLSTYHLTFHSSQFTGYHLSDSLLANCERNLKSPLLSSAVVISCYNAYSITITVFNNYVIISSRTRVVSLPGLPFWRALLRSTLVVPPKSFCVIILFVLFCDSLSHRGQSCPLSVASSPFSSLSIESTPIPLAFHVSYIDCVVTKNDNVQLDFVKTGKRE